MFQGILGGGEAVNLKLQKTNTENLNLHQGLTLRKMGVPEIKARNERPIIQEVEQEGRNQKIGTGMVINLRTGRLRMTEVPETTASKKEGKAPQIMQDLEVGQEEALDQTTRTGMLMTMRKQAPTFMVKLLRTERVTTANKTEEQIMQAVGQDEALNQTTGTELQLVMNQRKQAPIFLVKPLRTSVIFGMT